MTRSDRPVDALEVMASAVAEYGSHDVSLHWTVVPGERAPVAVPLAEQPDLRTPAGLLRAVTLCRNLSMAADALVVAWFHDAVVAYVRAREALDLASHADPPVHLGNDALARAHVEALRREREAWDVLRHLAVHE